MDDGEPRGDQAGKAGAAPETMSWADVLIGLIGEEIAEIGWSETARRSGYDRSYLHNTFGERRRKHNPSLRVVCDVAEAVGMEVQIVRRRA